MPRFRVEVRSKRNRQVRTFQVMGETLEEACGDIVLTVYQRQYDKDVKFDRLIPVRQLPLFPS